MAHPCPPRYLRARRQPSKGRLGRLTNRDSPRRVGHLPFLQGVNAATGLPPRWRRALGRDPRAHGEPCRRGSANLTDALDTFIIHADGTYVEANADGSVRLGAWDATSPTTANLTIVAYTRDETGTNLGGITIRLAIELNPDGNSYTAEGTIELTAPDGTRSGQAGPATGTATRMVVEAPGTPVMTLDELFGGATEATEATPTS